MNDPYAPPTFQTPHPQHQSPSVAPPAIALMVVSIICIAMMVLSLASSLFMLLSGAVDMLPDPRGLQISKETQIGIRMAWALILLAASAFTLYSAIQMKNLKSHSTAKMGAIVACIPCIGPCCIVGIPFGIWALIVLAKP